MVTYTVKDITDFYMRVGMLSMEVPEVWHDVDFQTLARVCNGVGGEGSWLSRILTTLYRHYQASAAIHDVCYKFGDPDRAESDAMFRRNMLREWKARYGRWRWLIAAKERAKIELAYLAVRRQGAKYYRGHLAELPTVDLT